MIITNCIVCDNKDLYKIIDLGLHPPSDSFLWDCGDQEAIKLYKLQCFVCPTCGHIQNRVLVSQNERYEEVDYSYTSANSKISKDHWDEYFKSINSYLNLSPSDVVIEFGSNDGYLLEQFNKRYLSIGIEPSPYLFQISSKKGLKIFNSYINQKTLNTIKSKYGNAKLIYGNNVFNHIHDLNAVTSAIRSVLDEDGYFVFESPYAFDVIKNMYFDTIYHEHISYFSVKSVDYLLRANKLYITEIIKNDYHGGCIRVFSSTDSSKYNKDLVNQFISNEEKFGLFNPKKYIKFMRTINVSKYKFMMSLFKMKSEGLKIAAVGAAARSNTLLNFYKIDNSLIDFITDNSEHKIGKKTPCSCIPILGDDALHDRNPDVAIILSWNIGKFLKAKIKEVNPKIKIQSISELM